ncbi:uncharacterized protein LOC122388291 [Amphibalanus amphitrite]|uniref:uncharacterized protein LOC122388291 n=1 Tax=Amphibalanus amphitrite TaxID=1232801 RepID=UPI001C91CF80|nr:uncharacterized protein LOC122388291 [Amphibalanus amphitrite]
MMELLWPWKRPTFNINFFNNMKTHNGNKENISSSSHGYDKLTTCDDRHIGAVQLGSDHRHVGAGQLGSDGRPIGLTELGSAAAAPSRLPPPAPPPAAARHSANDATPDSEDFSLTDDEDDRTCIVCDLTFVTRTHLRYHQKKKRHYGCSVCEDVFCTRIALEYHKEEADHWTSSDDEDEFMNQPDEQAMESEDDEQLLFY